MRRIDVANGSGARSGHLNDRFSIRRRDKVGDAGGLCHLGCFVDEAFDSIF